VHIDELYEAVDWDDRSPAAARTIHDLLLLMLCIREHPIVRPGCLRLLLAPGQVAPCSTCTLPGCPGNSWTGTVAVIRHFKTESSHHVHNIVVAPGSRTEKLLGEYTSWARALLATPGNPYTFISTKGGMFSSSAWYSYMPRLLSCVAELGWTRCVAVCALPLLPAAPTF
jgi:hypothetical protein